MAFSERLQILISADGGGAIREMNKVGVTAKTQLGGAQTSAEKWGSTFVRAGTAMVATAAVAGVGLYKLGNAASDVNEQMDASNLIFKKSAASVQEFASDATAGFGLSKRAALDAANTFGTLFVGIGKSSAEAAKMSVKMTKLAGDLASFRDTTPEEAIISLGAALRGESEPIRKYGVLLDDATLKQRALDEGLVSSTKGTLPPAIKAQAAYAEILAQTTLQQGNFALTAESAANQQRTLAGNFENLAAGIGQGVLPVMNVMLDGLNGLATGFGVLDDATAGAFGTVATFGTVAIAVLGSTLLVTGGVLKLRAAMLALGLSSPAGWAIAASGAVIALGDTVGGTAGNMIQMAGAGALLGSVIPGVGTAAGGAIGAVAGLGLSLLGVGKSTDKLKEAISDTRLWLGMYQDDASRTDQVLRRYGRGSEEVAANNKSLSVTAGAVAENFEKVAQESPKAANELLNHAQSAGVDADMLKKLRRILDENTTSDAELEQAASDATQAMLEQGRVGELTADQLRSLNDAAMAGVNAQLGLEGSLLNVESAQKRYNEAVVEHGAESLDAREAQHSLERSYYGVTEAIQKSADATGDSESATHDQIAALEYLAGGLAPSSPVRTFLDQYIMSLKAASGDFIARMVLQTPSNFRMGMFGPEINVGFGWRPVSMGPGGRLELRAHGGPVESNTPYMVGEQGPELFVPNASGSIVPNGAISRGGGTPAGGTTNVTVHVAGSVVTERQLVNAVHEGLLAKQRRSGSLRFN